MKDFDRTEIRAARSMSEANHWFDRNKGIAVRQEVHDSRKERWATLFNRMLMREKSL